MTRFSRAGACTGVLVGALVSVVGVVCAAPPPSTLYIAPIPTRFSMTVFGYLQIGDKPAAEGYEIAVFDPRGTLCGASGVDAQHDGAFLLQIYGDEPTTPAVVEGPQAGEALRFEVREPGAEGRVWSGRLVFRAMGLRPPPQLPPLFFDRGYYGMTIVVGASLTP